MRQKINLYIFLVFYVIYYLSFLFWLLVYFYHKHYKNNFHKDIKENKKTLVNGLLKHTVSNPERELNQLLCKIIHNRDKNAVQNMLNIVGCIMKTGKRPEPFTRKEETLINSSLCKTLIK